MAKTYPHLALVTLQELRRLMKRSEYLDHAKTMRVLDVPLERADAILREACTAGYLNYDADRDVPAWTRSEIGQSLVVNPLIKRLSRKQVLAVLDRVLAKAAALNAAPGLHTIREIRLFGSAALIGTPDEPEDFGDLDIEVARDRREGPDIASLMEAAIADLPYLSGFLGMLPPENQALYRDERRILRALKVARSVAIAEQEQTKILAAPYRLAYRCGGQVAFAGPSWAPDALITAEDPRHHGYGSPELGKGVTEEAPSYGRDMPERTLRDPHSIVLPERIEVAERCLFSIAEVVAARTRQLTAEDAGALPARPAGLEIAGHLGVCLPADMTARRRSWPVELRRALALLGGDERFAAAYIGVDQADLWLHERSGDEVSAWPFVSVVSSGARGRIEILGSWAPETLRLALAALPALRGASAWIPYAEDFDIRVSVYGADQAVSAAAAPGPAADLPVALFDRLREALVRDIGFAEDAADGRRARSARIEWYGHVKRLSARRTAGSAGTAGTRKAVRSAAAALVDAIEGSLGADTMISLAWRDWEPIRGRRRSKSPQSAAP